MIKKLFIQLVVMITCFWALTAHATAQKPGDSTVKQAETWGQKVKNLCCGISLQQPDSQILFTLQFKYTGPAATNELDTLHLLIPKTLQPDAAFKLTVKDQSGRIILPVRTYDMFELGYDDFVLEPDKIIERKIDMSDWFQWKSGQTYTLHVSFSASAYETAHPIYWTGTLESNEIQFTPK